MRTSRRVVALVALTTAMAIAVAAASHRDGDSARGIAHPDGVLRDLRLVLLIGAVGLVAALPGLLRGRRGAWWVALLSATLVGIVATMGSIEIGTALGGATVVALLVARGAFTAPTAGARVASTAAGMAAGLVGVFVYAAVGSYLLDGNFHETTTLAGSLYDGLRMTLLLPTTIVDPATAHGAWFVDSVRVLALLVVLVGLVRISVTVVIREHHRDEDRQRVGELLTAYGDSALAPFLVSDEKSWSFASDGRAVVGYRVAASTAVALGGPVGAADARADAVAEFAAHCDRHGWIPAFHQVRDADRPALEAAGFRILKIGEEAVVPLHEFDLHAPGMKSLRSTLKRVERVGSTFEVLQSVDDVTLRELREVSDAWMATGGHRERTFSVGRFDPAVLRTREIAIVRDADGRIVAFADLLPSYQSGLGNVDLMRRRPDSVNGVMELLFVRLIELFRARGYEGMTQGLAPLAGVDGSTVADRALMALRTHGTGFNFEGLREFKAKWRPRWESRYLAYRRERDLPTVALAIARVGELPVGFGARLKATVAEYPVSLAMLALALWLSVATALDHHVQRVIVGGFGLSEPDLRHGELWRLVTSAWVSPRAGFVWSNLVLLAVVLPLAERRFGTVRTAATFILGDLVASVTALGLLRVAADVGRHGAALDLVVRDTGQSAGAWTLAAALAVTAATTRRRRVLGALVAVVLLGQLAVFHRLFDLQHVIAALVGTGAGRRWHRGGGARANPRAGAERHGAPALADPPPRSLRPSVGAEPGDGSLGERTGHVASDRR